MIVAAWAERNNILNNLLNIFCFKEGLKFWAKQIYCFDWRRIVYPFKDKIYTLEYILN